MKTEIAGQFLVKLYSTSFHENPFSSFSVLCA